MPIVADLNLAEIPYDSGVIRYRYARVMGEDGTRWLRHGLFVEYAETGAVLSEGNYLLGKEHGLWRDFHANGRLAAEGHYHEGQQHGVWRFWNEAGAEEKAQNYQHGEERS